MSDKEEQEFNPWDMVIGVAKRTDFMRCVEQIVGVTAKESPVARMDKLMEMQEGLIGKWWWQFTPEDIELVLYRLRADQEKTEMVLRSCEGGAYRVRVPKRVAELIGGDEAVKTFEQFIEAVEHACSYTEFTVSFIGKYQVAEWAEEAGLTDE